MLTRVQSYMENIVCVYVCVRARNDWVHHQLDEVSVKIIQTSYEELSPQIKASARSTQKMHRITNSSCSSLGPAVSQLMAVTYLK